MSDQVTISLERYEEMKAEIASLEKKVEGKTIEVFPDWSYWLLFISVLAIFFAVIFFGHGV